MLKFNWNMLTIKTNADAERMRELFRRTNHIAGAFDTEDTGLHIIADKPFLYQFGWIDADTMQGYTFAVDVEQQPILSRQVIKVWQALAKSLPIYLGHNVTFDLHMMANMDMPYSGTNLSDTMSWIRLGTDAIPVRKGGAPLKLKQFAAAYITPDAKLHEHLLDLEKTSISSGYNALLKKALGWTKKQIDAFFNDKLNEAEDLPAVLRQRYYDWKSNLPLYLQRKVTGAVDSDMIRYDMLNRENVTRYGHYDIVWTLEAWWLLQQLVHNRGNMNAIDRENANIYPLYDMERTGFEIDKDYLMSCKTRMKAYILTRRGDLQQLAGRPISIGQHALIKTVLSELGLVIESTDSDVVDLVMSNLKHTGENPTALEFLETLQELRTLEKWYSTYLMRFMYNIQLSDRLYTQINASGAVGGRVTSDFQQFPKDAIVDVEGNELFQPRKLVVVSKGYKGIVYLDYSQIELRFQAMYTILVGHPDLNLCRAYMPYECHVLYTDGPNQYKRVFNPESPDDIKHAYSVDWYLNESPDTKWTPTDVHGATTKIAFGIDETHEDFHKLRYKGKRVNFAKNYGAQFSKIKTMFPEYDDAQIHKIDDAYYLAFPGVKKYHEYCYAIANTRPYAQNLFGVRYYGVSGHNLINMLVQGSAAYYLKWKIRQVWEQMRKMMQEKGYKSRLQMQIHDELSFEWHPDDPFQLFFDLKEIMEDWSDTLVPIVAEMELTTTCWAEKFAVKGIEDFEV